MLDGSSVFRLLENRLARESGKSADHTPFLPKVGELTYLRNNREAIAAMDFFTVPTLIFGVRHCVFVIGHDRRKILPCKVTRNRKLRLRLLKNRLVHEIGKRANHAPHTGVTSENAAPKHLIPLSGRNHATFAYVLPPSAPVSIAERDVICSPGAKKNHVLRLARHLRLDIVSAGSRLRLVVTLLHATDRISGHHGEDKH